MGSRQARHVHTASFTVTDAWFPPSSVLPDHTHDRSIVAVMLDGSFETTIAGRSIDCQPSVMWTEPRAERHANYIGRGGARVVVVQPQPSQHARLEPFAGLLDAVLHSRDAEVAAEARRLTMEMRLGDRLTPLAIDSRVMLLLTGAARLARRAAGGHRPPRWLQRVREKLHEEFRTAPSLAGLASSADVTPWHLAREFRRHYHTTPGAYARTVRLEWALGELARTRRPISEIAQSAGYSDQSHLTRACTAATGLAPAAYRRRERT